MNKYEGDTTYVFELTAKALKLMVNLKDLRLWYMGPGEFLSGCTFQLESLILSCFVQDKHVTEWLYTQKSLRHLDTTMLRIRTISDPPRITTTLRSIKGNHDDLLALAPGRTIAALDYEYMDPDDRESYIYDRDLVERAASDIKYLRLSTLDSYFRLENDLSSLRTVVMVKIMFLVFSIQVPCFFYYWTS